MRTSLAEICRWGDKFLNWYQRGCRKADPQLDPHDFETFCDAWDRYSLARLADLDGRSMSDVYLYAAASLGFRREYRQQLVVWKDRDGRTHYPVTRSASLGIPTLEEHRPAFGAPQLPRSEEAA